MEDGLQSQRSKLKDVLLYGLSVVALALAIHLPLKSHWQVSAADHTDSPTPTANPLLDITDIYAFRDNNDLIIAMCTNPVTNQPTTKFSPGDFYVINIDNNGDNVPDIQYTFQFDSASPQNFTASGFGSSNVTGTVSANTGTETIVNIPSGGEIFCGLRDDPFFFDLVGFQAFLTNLYLPDNGLRLTSMNGNPADAFAGGNVSAIVVRVPITSVNGVPTDPNMGTVRIWAKTFKA